MTLTSEWAFRGRLSRPDFWLRHLILVPIALWLPIAAGITLGAPWDLPFALALVALLISVWGRRLHDRGRSAWWLLAVAVPVLGAAWLTVECGLRGSSLRGERYGVAPAERSDYLSVSDSPAEV